ncbi:MAG: hypothetical protein Q7U68_02270 [Candidatus Roizmanbacteria bacterium]|nr:hypothetical protein [Candidatus Roizmanbacteria bacterium]
MENRPSKFINNAITRIKGYRPPPLKVILNGQEGNDGSSNITRGNLSCMMMVLAYASPLIVDKIGLKVNNLFFGLTYITSVMLYGGEAVRQLGIGIYKKNQKNQKITFYRTL